MFLQFSRVRTSAPTSLAASTDSTACGTRDFFEQIEQAVRSERLAPAPDPRKVAAALKVQSRSSVQKALQLLKTLDKALFQVNTFHSNAVLSGCHNWEENLELLKEFKSNSCADAVSYNCVMNSLKWPIILALVDNLKTLNSDTNNGAKELQDLTISYNRLISSCKTQDAWKQSLHFLLMIEMEELRPDQFSYMAALDVLQKSKLCLWRRSCHILNSMPALVQPDIFSWNSMLASVPDSNWKTNVHLLNSMRSMRFFCSGSRSYNTSHCFAWRRLANCVVSLDIVHKATIEGECRYLKLSFGFIHHTCMGQSHCVAGRRGIKWDPP